MKYVALILSIMFCLNLISCGSAGSGSDVSTSNTTPLSPVYKALIWGQYDPEPYLYSSPVYLKNVWGYMIEKYYDDDWNCKYRTHLITQDKSVTTIADGFDTEQAAKDAAQLNYESLQKGQ